jgi:colicin import membrane protein
MAASATLTPLQDPLLPRAPGGHRAGAAMATLVHVGLLIALTFSVDWRTRTPDVVSAELWASVPQMAAPKPVEERTAPPVPAPKPVPTSESKAPEPTPVTPPDIALERAREQAAKKKAAADAKALAEAEQKRLLTEKAEDKNKADAEKKKRQEETAAKAEETQLAKQREENLKRMMGQAESSKGSGPAAQDAAPSASYVGKLARRIRDENLVYTGTAPDSATVEITIRSAPGGTLLGREVVKRSGFPDWDEAVLRAIDKAGALPRDNDGRVPREITIAFRRRD